MTIRVEISVVPYGNEDLKSEICTLDISNVELVEDRGFGNQICNYQVTLKKPALDSGGLHIDYEDVTGKISEHNRRDGVIELVRKACELMDGCL